MNDLPLFLQMFVRMFAALALGAALFLFSNDSSEKSADANKDRPAAAGSSAKATEEEHAANDAPNAAAGKLVGQPKP